MKILMIYPKYQLTFWSYKYALRFINKPAVLPPLGLLTVAAMLPKEWKLKLVDMNVETLSDSQIKDADYVMISAMGVQEQSVNEVLKRCKDLGKVTICGGPLFSSNPEKYDDVDHLLLFDGEDCVPEFLHDLSLGKAKHIYNKQTFPDLSTAPVPRWDLINIKNYKMLNMQFSRGCPFNCDFCEVGHLFGKKHRSKSLEQILNELDAIYETGYREDIAFGDDNFIGNKAYLKKEILPEMIEWMEKHDHPFTFFTEVSLNIADDEELMDMMVKAGFENIFVGIETIDDSCLEECGKVQNQSRDMLDSIKKIQNHGLQIYSGLIVGFDNDKPDVFDRMYQFIMESGIVINQISLLTAIPGTKLYERLEAEDRIIGRNSEDMTDTNIITRMDPDVLKKGYVKLLNDIYEPEHLYERIRTFFGNYKYPGLHKLKVSSSEVKAFLKACYYMGIVDRKRKHYWSLLLWTFRKRREAPWMLSGAVIFSILGYNFREYVKNHIEI